MSKIYFATFSDNGAALDPRQDTLKEAIAIACAWCEEKRVIDGVAYDLRRVAKVYLHTEGDYRTLGDLHAVVRRRDGITSIERTVKLELGTVPKI